MHQVKGGGDCGVYLLPCVGPSVQHWPQVLSPESRSIFTTLPHNASGHLLSSKHIYLCFLRWSGDTDRFSHWLHLFCFLQSNCFPLGCILNSHSSALVQALSSQRMSSICFAYWYSCILLLYILILCILYFYLYTYLVLYAK